MVAVIDNKLVFGREQVLTSTQASKNFGEARRRARREPQFVSDRNDGIDTVNLGYMVEIPGLNARIQPAEGRRDENVKRDDMP